MIAVLVWFFLIVSVSNPNELPRKSIEFRWWVDCEDARADMFFWSATFEPVGPCVEGVPTAVVIQSR